MGKINARRLWTLSTGCFLLFSGSTLASGSKDFYLLKLDGQAKGHYSDSFEIQPAEKSVTTRQEWVDLGAAPSELSLKSISLNDPFLSPVSFETHFKSRDGKKEFKLFVRIKKNGKFKDLSYRFEGIKPVRELREKQFIMPADPIFHSALPRYLAKIEPGMYVMRAILEDVRDAKLETRPMRIIRMAEKKEIKGLICHRSSIDINGVVADDEGKLCALSMPDMKTEFSLSSMEEIKKTDPRIKF